MTTTRQVTTIPTPLVSAAWYGDFADDFDTEAIETDVRNALENAAAEHFPGGHEPYIAANGDVYVFDIPSHVEAARTLDWRGLLDEIDVASIAARHETH